MDWHVLFKLTAFTCFLSAHTLASYQVMAATEPTGAAVRGPIYGVLCSSILKNRHIADMTNTCVYYTMARVQGKCVQTLHHCPPGKKVSENLYYREGDVCQYDIDPSLDDPCKRRNSYLALVYETTPWECYGDTPCCFSRSGQKAEDCSQLKLTKRRRRR